jgi:VIT1/CCC1 family predicted Fe2+/Mn2+ transporter
VLGLVDPPQKQQFREQVRHLIAEKLTGSASATVSRQEVEDIGASLGMKSDEACQEFLALQDTLWATRTGSIAASTSTTDESRAYSPPRNWSAFKDVVLA